MRRTSSLPSLHDLRRIVEQGTAASPYLAERAILTVGGVGRGDAENKKDEHQIVSAARCEAETRQKYLELKIQNLEILLQDAVRVAKKEIYGSGFEAEQSLIYTRMIDAEERAELLSQKLEVADESSREKETQLQKVKFELRKSHNANWRMSGMIDRRSNGSVSSRRSSRNLLNMSVQEDTHEEHNDSNREHPELPLQSGSRSIESKKRHVTDLIARLYLLRTHIAMLTGDMDKAFWLSRQAMLKSQWTTDRKLEDWCRGVKTEMRGWKMNIDDIETNKAHSRHESLSNEISDRGSTGVVTSGSHHRKTSSIAQRRGKRNLELKTSLSKSTPLTDLPETDTDSHMAELSTKRKIPHSLLPAHIPSSDPPTARHFSPRTSTATPVPHVNPDFAFPPHNTVSISAPETDNHTALAPAVVRDSPSITSETATHERQEEYTDLVSQTEQTSPSSIRILIACEPDKQGPKSIANELYDEVYVNTETNAGDLESQPDAMDHNGKIGTALSPSQNRDINKWLSAIPVAYQGYFEDGHEVIGGRKTGEVGKVEFDRKEVYVAGSRLQFERRVSW